MDMMAEAIKQTNTLETQPKAKQQHRSCIECLLYFIHYFILYTLDPTFFYPILFSSSKLVLDVIITKPAKYENENSK